jgi:hypothetical protein
MPVKHSLNSESPGNLCAIHSLSGNMPVYRHADDAIKSALTFTKIKAFSLFPHFLRISRVFDRVKKPSFHILSVLVLSASTCFAQNDAVPAMGFADSVRIVLENTRNLDATVVGASFVTAWSGIGLDQQQLIKKHMQQMKRKGYKLRPHMLPYVGAVAAAITIEGADAATLGSFLHVCDKVIANYNATKAITFFTTSRSFFERHTLYADKSYRLYAKEGRYTFEYLEFIPPPIDTTTQVVDEYNNDTWVDEPIDTVYHEPPPYWETQDPPPLIEGAIIRFTGSNLNFVTSHDSVFLKNTNGIYSLTTSVFAGEGGSFDWTPALLSSDVVQCTMMQYNFNTKKPELKSSLVKLNYAGKTPGFIPGTFEFKSQARKDSVASSYPRFTSYQSNLVIQGLGNANLKYTGGFSLFGNRIASNSVNREYSTIVVEDDVAKKFKARSREFIFQDSAVVANQAAFTIYHQNDSITHHSVQMRYEYNSEKLLLQSEKGLMKNAPYSSSFFNMDFAAGIIKWDLKADSLDISTRGARATVPMILESIDYYKPEDFKALEGVGFKFHALALVARYCINNNTREFSSGDLARVAGYDIIEVQKAIEFLAQKGLVEYWPQNDKIIVKEKAVTQYRAYKGEVDYDNLKIQSVSGSYIKTDLKAPVYSNATLSFKNRNMVVRGVDGFNVSDSLNVFIKPDSSTITVLQNRDIKFDGNITAGNFEVFGKQFTLKYDSFFISLDKIDSINFYTMEKNARGQMERKKINNSMVGADSTAAAAGGMASTAKSSGTLYINRPGNKSGKEKIPNYPRLDAAAGGVIYFDRQEVLNGVYDRSVFFVVPPFKLDSLNDADPASLNFEGSFISSGMFPAFKEKLHSMPDKSLGFNHPVPASGYQLYKSDATLFGNITLDKKGLRSPGKIEYLAATVYSSDFVFYPDSVSARGTRATLSEKQFGSVLFPQASLPNYQMKWFPKQDQMKLRNTTVPFNFYDSTAQLTGTITVSKSGVTGIGKLETRGSELRSREMNFSANDFGARHARFQVKSADPTKALIDGTDVRVKFNLGQNYADISPEIEGEAAINFPFAQFKTSIPNARWDFKSQKITMTKRADVPIENSYFYTTRKDLDSLGFYAEGAEYDLTKQEMLVSGIPYITVADARITPDKGQVLILENAKIGTLKNTTIILDTLNGYHRLTDGVVDIFSRNEFTGYATYQYVNLLKDTFAIKMTDFHLEPVVETEQSKRFQRRKTVASMQTVGVGRVEEDKKLVLGAGMFYKGDLTMYATKPALQLTGYIKLDLKNVKNYKDWIAYSQTGDEPEVLIDFDKALTEDGKKVEAGLHFSSLENELYVTFLNDKGEEDDDFFVPSGTLHYDTASKEYKIEDREKAAGNKLSGKVFAYNDETMQVRFEGPVNLFKGIKDFNITGAALGNGNIKSNEIRMNALVMMNTNVITPVLDIMARDLQVVIEKEGAEEGIGDQTELLYKIADLVGERVAKDFETRSAQNYVSLGELAETSKALTFANVNLKWSVEHKAFYSEGMLGVSNSFRNDINAAFEGFMEIKKTEDGASVFHVFFKASPEAWYYFGFEDNRLLMYSSNSDFNSLVTKKSNAGKAKMGEVVFIPGTEEETKAFINRFRREYYGIEVPYNMGDDLSRRKKDDPTKKKEENDGF